MSVSNGVIQTVIQGRHDETNTPPKLVTGTTNDDEASTLVTTPLLVANASLSEDGGDTNSGSDNGLQGGGGQVVSRGTCYDSFPFLLDFCLFCLAFAAPPHAMPRVPPLLLLLLASAGSHMTDDVSLLTDSASGARHHNYLAD